MTSPERTSSAAGLPKTDIENGRQEKGKDKEPTFGDRLQASGRLVIDSVTSPQPLPGLATSEKAASSASRNSRGESSASYNTAKHRSQAPGEGESFRGGVPHSGGTSQAFEDFQGQLKPASANEHITSPQVLPQSLARQESSDGYAVVELLGRPNGEEEPVNCEGQDVLSPEAAANLRTALFGSELDTSVWASLLDFTPDFIKSPENASGPELRQYLGTTDPVIARQIWAQQWADVLSSYTDEVWGGLGSLVSEAKQEIDQLTESHNGIDQVSSKATAVNRLRQILAHVRAHS